MQLNGNGRTGIRSIVEDFDDHRDHQVPSHDQIKATIDGEETTFKRAKCTAAARDLADLPDSISPGGILEGRQKYQINNMLTLSRPESRDSLKITVIGLPVYPLHNFICFIFVIVFMVSKD